MKTYLVLSFFVLLLSSCGGNLSQFGVTTVGNDATTIEKREKDGDVELILHPVAVWDERGAAESETINVDGKDIQVRVRKKDIFEKSFVKMGLFWHSRGKNIFVPVSVSGPSVEIRQLEIYAGGNFSVLKRAKNFNYTPGKSKFNSDKISFAAFEMKPSLLAALVKADTVEAVIKTSRGNLKLGLDVVAGDSISDARINARRLFSVFADKIAANKRGG